MQQNSRMIGMVLADACSTPGAPSLIHHKCPTLLTVIVCGCVFYLLSLSVCVWREPCSRSVRTGSTVLRDRLLEVKGFSVLSIPYWEWQAQKQEDLLQWLERRLVQAAASPPRGKPGAASRVDLASYA